jgi:hypothetical protein
VDTAQRLLRELVRAQRASGGWGEPRESVEQTAAAVVALARAGNTAEKGIFRRQARRALDWLSREATATSERLYLLWARGEVAATDGKPEAIEPALQEAEAIVAAEDSGPARAIRARLRALLNLPASDRYSSGADGRLAVIVAESAAADSPGLPLSWRACGAAGRSDQS